MKKIAMALTIASAALIGGFGAANAQVRFHVGPGGAYVGFGHRHHHHWGHYRGGPYAYAPCRWVVRRHWSRRWHGWVTRRERVCY